MKEFMTRLSSRLDRLVRWTTAALLCIMVAVTTAGVISRYGFNSALSWSEELARYLLVWISFLGAAIAAHDNSHIGISFLVDRLPPGLRNQVAAVTDLMVIVFTGAILTGGIRILPLIHARTAPTLGIPMSLPYAIMPLACGAIIIHTWVRLTGRILGRDGK